VGVSLGGTVVVEGASGVKVAVAGVKAVGVNVFSAGWGVAVGSLAGGKGTQVAVMKIAARYRKCRRAFLFISFLGRKLLPLVS
jgi:hypothetical protein